MEQNNEIQKLLIEDRKRLAISCVQEVEGFSEQQIRLTISNSTVLISGDKLKITQFNKATGNLQAEGEINSIRYDVKKAPLVKRLFK